MAKMTHDRVAAGIWAIDVQYVASTRGVAARVRASLHVVRAMWTEVRFAERPKARVATEGRFTKLPSSDTIKAGFSVRQNTCFGGRCRAEGSHSARGVQPARKACHGLRSCDD